MSKGLFGMYADEELLVEVRRLQAGIPEICRKLSDDVKEEIDWDAAQKMAADLKVDYPAVTGNLECDAHIAFIVATQPKNPKFVGMRAARQETPPFTSEPPLLPATRENWAKFDIGDTVVYEFSRDGEDEPLVFWTRKHNEWLDTPPFSGSVWTKDSDDSNHLSLTQVAEVS